MRSIIFTVTVIADFPEGNADLKDKHAQHRVKLINSVLQERADSVFSAQLTLNPTDIRGENTES